MGEPTTTTTLAPTSIETTTTTVSTTESTTTTTTIATTDTTTTTTAVTTPKETTPESESEIDDDSVEIVVQTEAPSNETSSTLAQIPLKVTSCLDKRREGR